MPRAEIASKQAMHTLAELHAELGEARGQQGGSQVARSWPCSRSKP